jgi:hypothetical protein
MLAQQSQRRVAVFGDIHGESLLVEALKQVTTRFDFILCNENTHTFRTPYTELAVSES